VTSAGAAYRFGGFSLRYIASPLSHAVAGAGILLLTFGNLSIELKTAVAVTVVVHALVFGRTFESWIASGRRMADVLKHFAEGGSFTEEGDNDNDV